MFLGIISILAVISIVLDIGKDIISMDEEQNVNENNSFITGVWSEKVLVVTKDYQIKGNVFMPKTGRKNRVLSDILNGSKRFVAIKNCEVVHREFPNRRTEVHEFLQLNLNSIILLRPLNEE